MLYNDTFLYEFRGFPVFKYWGDEDFIAIAMTRGSAKFIYVHPDIVDCPGYNWILAHEVGHLHLHVDEMDDTVALVHIVQRIILAPFGQITRREREADEYATKTVGKAAGLAALTWLLNKFSKESGFIAWAGENELLARRRHLLSL